MSRAESYAQRIRNRSEAEGIDAGRLHRNLVFQRILARVARADGWVLKGGFCLEVRLALEARTTVDLDLATREVFEGAGEDLQDTLDELLAAEVDEDEFTFDVAQPRRVNMLGDRDAWRIRVTARVDGQVFQDVTLDVVSQFTELAGAVEALEIAPPVAAPGLRPVRVAAVDVDQHAAEKLHAMMRVYAGERPSSRTKDLVDLVLLLEAGLLDAHRLADRLAVVYGERDGTAPPEALAPLPAGWEQDYPALLGQHELTVTAQTAASAYELVRDLYQQVVPFLEAASK